MGGGEGSPLAMGWMTGKEAGFWTKTLESARANPGKTAVVLPFIVYGLYYGLTTFGSMLF